MFSDDTTPFYTSLAQYGAAPAPVAQPIATPSVTPSLMQPVGWNSQDLPVSMGGGFGFGVSPQTYQFSAPAAVAPAQPGILDSMQSWLKDAVGTKDQPGWGGMALGTARALGNAWMGMQQYGLAKKSLAENMRQFQLNFDAQRGMTNSRLADRQAARVASNPGAYESVGSYMDRYGVKG